MTLVGSIAVSGSESFARTESTTGNAPAFALVLRGAANVSSTAVGGRFACTFTVTVAAPVAPDGSRAWYVNVLVPALPIGSAQANEPFALPVSVPIVAAKETAESASPSGSESFASTPGALTASVPPSTQGNGPSFAATGASFTFATVTVNVCVPDRPPESVTRMVTELWPPFAMAWAFDGVHATRPPAPIVIPAGPASSDHACVSPGFGSDAVAWYS